MTRWLKEFSVITDKADLELPDGNEYSEQIINFTL